MVCLADGEADMCRPRDWSIVWGGPHRHERVSRIEERCVFDFMGSVD